MCDMHTSIDYSHHDPLLIRCPNHATISVKTLNYFETWICQDCYDKVYLAPDEKSDTKNLGYHP
jgi:hypothetical protein